MPIHKYAATKHEDPLFSQRELTMHCWFTTLGNAKWALLYVRSMRLDECIEVMLLFTCGCHRQMNAEICEPRFIYFINIKAKILVYYIDILITLS